MPRLTQERQLLDAFRLGERRALEEVYRHYAPMLSRQLLAGVQIEASGQRLKAIPHGWCDIEVIVQETFTRAFTQKVRASYDGLRPYSGFLLGVARFVLLDAHRKHRQELARFVPLEDESIQDPRGEPQESPEELAASKEERDLILEFLSSCTEEELAVYRLRYEEGLSQDAAAKRCQTTRMKLRVIEQHLLKGLLSFAKKRGLFARTTPTKGKGEKS